MNGSSKEQVSKKEDMQTDLGKRQPQWVQKQLKWRLRTLVLPKNDIDFIVFATLSPDYTFPGCGVLLQRAMGLKNIGALDVRNQCSGFIYALSVADQFIRSGMYKNILVVGAEKHSFALDFSTRGRAVSVMFGDGAGAVVLQPTEKENDGILSTHLHCDGSGAEILACYNPGTHSNHWAKETIATYPEQDWFGSQYITQEMIDNAQIYPNMDGHAVMKRAIYISAGCNKRSTYSK
jgi:3-oxoacyl-[acyl-carrier-protein] synthase-3